KTRDGFSLPGAARRLAHGWAPGPTRPGVFTRSGGEDLRPESHAGKRRRALGVAAGRRTFLCLRRREPHGEGRRRGVARSGAKSGRAERRSRRAIRPAIENREALPARRLLI